MTDTTSPETRTADYDDEVVGTYPLPPGLLESIAAERRPMAGEAESREGSNGDGADPVVVYEDVIETICGTVDDSRRWSSTTAR